VGDNETTSRHILDAHGYLTKAKQLIPNCVSISNLLARVLLMALKVDEAEKVALEQ
jgi:hypothetical protein